MDERVLCMYEWMNVYTYVYVQTACMTNGVVYDDVTYVYDDVTYVYDDVRGATFSRMFTCKYV